MQKKKQWNVLEMPLFEPPNYPREIWQSQSESAKQEIITLTAGLIKQYQELKKQGGDGHE